MKIRHIIFATTLAFAAFQTISAETLVGATEGQHGTTATGAATYSVPVECPDGVNGLKPNITINYNSQAGNGLLGIGWNIGGLSSIMRTTKTIYHDGEVRPFSYGADSPFALDGNRLFVYQETADSIIYFPENNDAYCKVVGYKTANFTDGPAYFKVYHKNGQVWQYGADSKTDRFTNYCISTTGLRLGWMLKQITDSNGNRIEYSYTGDVSGTLVKNVRINSITYAHGRGAGEYPGGYATIYFSYEDRPDIITFYQNSSFPITQSKRLKSITASSVAMGSPFRKYTLEYECSAATLYKSNLVKITESAGNDQLNPTVIEWGKRTESEYMKTETISTENFYGRNADKYFPVDYNLDGYTDLASLSGISFYENYNTRDMGLASETLNSRISSVFTFNRAVTNKNVLVCRHRNLNKYDFLRSYIADNEYFYLGDYNINRFVSIPVYNAADLNNDGYDDVIISYKMSDNTIDVVVYYGRSNSIITERGYVKRMSLSVNPLLAETPGGIVLCDLNNDGLKDVVLVTNKGSKILRNDGDGFTHVSNALRLLTKYQIEIADFNNDGLADFFCNAIPGCCPVIYINQSGFSFKEQFAPCEMRVTADDIERNQSIAYDFNSDGRTDVIVIGNTEICWYENKKDSLIKETGQDILKPIFSLVRKQNVSNGYSLVKNNVLGDFDGDGRPDILSYSSDLYNVIAKDEDFHLHTLNLPYDVACVRSITDGLGRKVSFEYKPLTDPSVYSHDNTQSNGTTITDVTAPLRVVSAVRVEAGTERNAQKYRYKNALMHTQGKGLLGFVETLVTDSVRSVTSKTINSLNATYFVLTPDSVSTFTTAGQVISATKYACTLYRPYTALPHTFNTRITEQTDYDCLSGVKVKTENKWNIYGNIYKTTKTYDNGLTETVNITYQIKGAWCQNVPVYRKEERTLGGQTESVITRYAYDDKGNLTQQTDYDGTTFRRVTAYEYDLYGNPTHETQTVNGGMQTKRETFYEYGQTGRFPKKVTDDFGNETIYNYAVGSGLLTSTTDRYGTTTYSYDSFGRLKKTVFPDGREETVTLNQDDNKIITTIAETGRPYHVKICNNSGNEISSSTINRDGQVVETDKVYDNMGYLRIVHTPHTLSSSGYNQQVVDEYDAFGRVLAVKNYFDSKFNYVTTTYTYDGLTTTEQTPEHKTVTRMNAAGQTESVTTDGKKVTYEYTPSGRLKNATPQGGEPVTMEYDAMGNRTKITDPDAGVVTSVYNAWGQLSSTSREVNGKTISTWYTYNSKGQLFVKNQNNEFTTRYTYDDLQRLVLEAVDNGPSVAYEYDGFDRLTRKTETIDGNEYVYQYAYDSIGNLVKETYPSGYYVENTYNAYGYLTKVTDSRGGTLWEFQACDEYNRITKERVGNHLRTASYNFMGQPLAEACDTLFSLAYSYNAKRQMSEKRNLLTGDSYRFAYDNMGRLTAWNLYGSENAIKKRNRLQYNTVSGNIAQVDGGEFYELAYGEYGYPKHAVTSVTADIESIPHDEQRITYTPFRKAETIEEGDYRYELTYGPDEQRRKSVLYKDEQPIETRIYIGGYEKLTDSLGNIVELHYISGGNGLCGVYVKTAGGDTLYHAFTDYQSNLIALAGQDGGSAVRMAYDPWGNRVNPDDWTQKDDAETLCRIGVNRGYTMHEYLDEFNLINMNGRMYDPWLLQFLSPDPYVQAPGNWLNYNSYAYCYGNPMQYIDPSGEIAWFVPVIIGAVIGATSGAVIGHQNGATGWNMFGYIAGGAIIGGASGFASVGVSAAGGGAMLAGMAGGAVAGAGFNGLATNWDGISMLKGGLIGGFSGLVGGGVGAAIGGGAGAFCGGAVAAGLNTALNGGDLKQIGISMLLGGALSYGTYELTSFIAWKTGGNNMGGVGLNYKQYKTMQADFQRARFWHKEYGGFIMENGTVERFPKSWRHSYGIDLPNGIPNDAKAMYHTHWDGFEKTVYLNNGDKVNALDVAFNKYNEILKTSPYHGEFDFMPIDSYVINRYNTGLNYGGTQIVNPIRDSFLRYYPFYFF